MEKHVNSNFVGLKKNACAENDAIIVRRAGPNCEFTVKSRTTRIYEYKPLNKWSKPLPSLREQYPSTMSQCCGAFVQFETVPSDVATAQAPVSLPSPCGFVGSCSAMGF
eukprot:6362404-Amphidinium_carterae.1